MTFALLAAIAALGGDRVDLGDDLAVFDTRSNAPAEARFRFMADGRMLSYTETDGSYTEQGDWVVPTASAPGDYECKATMVSGSVTGAATGSWLAMSSTREWKRVQAAEGFSSAVFDVSVRKGTGPTLDTRRITLNATNL